MDYQGTEALLPWQSLLIGGFSGGMGPLVNNPLDVVKTRMQKQVVHPGKQPKYTGLLQACTLIAKEEGPLALWKGITPRLMRIMPGQAITFMTYEFVSSRMHKLGFFN
jgi:solute carrier family 25 citrate transporter 1